jgi:hypothetical protein
MKILVELLVRNPRAHSPRDEPDSSLFKTVSQFGNVALNIAQKSSNDNVQHNVNHENVEPHPAKPSVSRDPKSNCGWPVHFVLHRHIGSMRKADHSLTECREALAAQRTFRDFPEGNKN